VFHRQATRVETVRRGQVAYPFWASTCSFHHAFFFRSIKGDLTGAAKNMGLDPA